MECFADHKTPANTRLCAMFDETTVLLDSNSGNFFPSEG